MTHEPKRRIHHVDEAKEKDGKINIAKVKAHAAQAFEQIDNGHYVLEQMGQQEIEPGRIKRWFITKEVDHRIPAVPDPAE